MKKIFDTVAKYFMGEDLENDIPENDTATPSEDEEIKTNERVAKKSKVHSSRRIEKEPVEERPTRYSSESSSFSSYSNSRINDSDTSSRRSASKLLNMNSITNQSNMIITQITEYADCKDVIKQLKERKSVIINVDQMDKVDARRAVDFLSGAITAIDGDIKKIANSIIVVAPSNVKLTGIFGEEIPSNINDNNF